LFTLGGKRPQTRGRVSEPRASASGFQSFSAFR